MDINLLFTSSGVSVFACIGMHKNWEKPSIPSQGNVKLTPWQENANPFPIYMFIQSADGEQVDDTQDKSCYFCYDKLRSQLFPFKQEPTLLHPPAYLYMQLHNPELSILTVILPISACNQNFLTSRQMALDPKRFHLIIFNFC